jgi:hypothetical protein
MGVYLGDNGHIELKRDQTDPTAPSIQAVITKDEVNVERRSFSVEEAYLSFITGDRLEITTVGTDPEDVTTRPKLNFIAGIDDTSITRYVHVDSVGRMRLYDDFEGAVNGQLNDAIELVEPAENQNIRLRSAGGSKSRCLAQVTSYSFTSSRSNINTTVLSQQYVDQYEAGLIQGQGQLSCFWEHKYGGANCDTRIDYDQELPAYLAKLVLRLNQGSDFWGRFFIYTGDDRQKSVWYECPKCIVTNVVVNVTPDQIITTDIDFITAAGFTLRTGYPPGFILQEDGDLLLEEGSGLPLEFEDQG